ncbi:hypothetical protein [Modestobacter sp. VKM Ac-2984]|uniref:hypothetical protein n=1 Tax=Modestobacter sp. VKM Ac-2984 TaxID=3004138 RepID=UPI0022AA30F8|nr:hypothetical protein [Modestobacter sp. VKM Ac-2984]MCZ2817321.1 hypothetical protein [Modestobacter sp. VKM Ac-2984]
MAWWWLLVAWPVLGLLAAAVFHVVVANVPPDRCYELPPAAHPHRAGRRALGLRRRPGSRPPAGRPGVATTRHGLMTAAGTARLVRGPVHRIPLQARLVPRRRPGTSSRSPLTRVSGAVADACCGPRRTADRTLLATGARRHVTVPVPATSHQPSRPFRPLGAGGAPTGPARRIGSAWTRRGAHRPGPHSRVPQRLVALTALSAIALAPVLARSSSSLGFSDPLSAQLAANPDQVPATWDALNQGAAISGLTTPVTIPGWEAPLADRVQTDTRDRSPEPATDSRTGTSTDQPRRTDTAPATSTDGPTSEPSTVPPAAVPDDQPPASDAGSGGGTRTTAPTPTDPADPTVSRPTPTPSPTDPEPTPEPTPDPEPTPTPEPTPNPEPTPTPSPTDPEPTPTPSPTTDPEPTPTDPAEPTEPTPTDAEPTPSPTGDTTSAEPSAPPTDSIAVP